MANEFRVKNGLIVDEVSSGAGVVTIADGVISSAQTMEILSTANADQSILMRENGGTDGTIKIHADQGSGTDSIFLLSDAGGIQVHSTAGVLDFNAGTNVTMDAAENITLTAADDVGLVTTSADGEIVLQSAHTLGRAIFIDGNANAGSIVDIDAGVLTLDSDGSTSITAATTLDLVSSGVMTLTTNDHDDILLRPHSGQYVDVDGLFKVTPSVAASDRFLFSTTSNTTLTAQGTPVPTPFTDFPATGFVKIQGMNVNNQPFAYTRVSDSVITADNTNFDTLTNTTGAITLVPTAQSIVGQAAPTSVVGQLAHDGGQVTLDGGKWGNAGNGWAVGVNYGAVVLQDSISAKKLKALDNGSSLLYKPNLSAGPNNTIPIFHVGGENQSLTAFEDYFTAPGTTIASGNSSTPSESVYVNFKVVADTLALVKVKQKLSGSESNTDSRLGSAIVSETMSNKGMNGIFFNIDDAGHSIFGTGSDNQGSHGSIGDVDYNFAVGHMYNGATGTNKRFAMGYSNRSFNNGSSLANSPFADGSTTFGAEGNALAKQNSFFQANIDGFTAVGPAAEPTDNVTLTVGTNGETNVGGVILLEEGSTDPSGSGASHTLYNKSGTLHFNGSAVGSGATASALKADDLEPGDDVATLSVTSNVTANNPAIIITAGVADTDIHLKGIDGSSNITMLALDASEAGAATFSSSVTAGAAGFIVGSTVITDDSIVMTPTSGDTATIAASTNGALAITTVDTASAAANITITADGTFDVAATSATIESTVGDITLDAAGADVILKDNGTQYGSLTNSSGELVIRSGSTPTTAITMSGANVTIAGNLTVSGTTTAVNTTTMTVEDAIIELGLVNGSAPTNTTSVDLGMAVNYYTGSAKKAALWWDTGAQHWALADDVSESGQVLSATGNATGLRFYYDDDNYFNIGVDDKGATQITTVDSTGEEGDLTIAPDGKLTLQTATDEDILLSALGTGDITLNAHGGDVLLKANTTSFGQFTNSTGDMHIKAAAGKGISLMSNTGMTFLIEDDAPGTAGTNSIFQFTTEATVGTDLTGVDAEFEPVVMQYTSGSTNLGRTEFGQVTQEGGAGSNNTLFTFDSSAFQACEVLIHTKQGEAVSGDGLHQVNKMIICAASMEGGVSPDTVAFSNYSEIYSDGSTKLVDFNVTISSDIVSLEFDATDDDLLTYSVTFLA